MLDGDVARLGTLIDAAVRALARGGPPPRGLPAFGLESTSGTAAVLLDGLAARGLFRKYELVLALGDALGQTARWLAGGRLGCRAVATAPGAASAAVARALTRRAGLQASAHHVPVAGAALPFRDAVFTHVWLVESLPALGTPDVVLRAAWRVLRPGGHLAVQELRAAGGDDERIAVAAAAAGFVDVERRDAGADAVERSARVQSARAALLDTLASSGGATLAGEAARRRALAVALADGRLRVVQLHARRP